MRDKIILVGFEGTNPVPAGTQAKFTAHVHGPGGFAPRALTIPRSVGDDFDVLDVRARGQSLWNGTGPLPAGIFAERIVGIITEDEHVPMFARVELKPGEHIEMTVFNKASEPRGMHAVLSGPVTDDEQEKVLGASAKVVDGPLLMHESFDGLTSLKGEAEEALDPLGRWKDMYLKTAAQAFDVGAMAADATRESRESVGEGRTVLGFDTTPIPPFGCLPIKKHPQVTCQFDDLQIPESIVNYLAVVDLKVGRNSQFSASGEVPAARFSEKAVRPSFKCQICEVGMEVTIVVRNLTDKVVNFTASMSGPCDW